MRRRMLGLLVVLASATGTAGPARGESTVIRDTRLASLGATPALGRGFTPAISSLHSICFDRMPVTTPSYDFEYMFEDVERTATSRGRSSLRTDEIDEFVRQNLRTSRIAKGSTTHYMHHLLAVLVVDSYYASIDEAHAELSKHAIELLSAGDAQGFFTGCGTHYIRSLSRRSYFLTMFSYTSTTSKRDEEFELRLEHQVRRFHGSDDTPEAKEVERRFSQLARDRDLRVVTRSIGLTARKDANLLPFDLATYKESVKAAFTASQEPDAGRIVAMEIMPWLANTRVLVTLDLRNGPSGGASWTQRRRILADNAEFYIELASALDEMSTQVHRAEACRRELDQDVREGDAIKPRYVGASVISHRTGRRLPLTTLLEALSDANIDKMRATGLAWRNGPDGKSGASACLDELERTGLSGRYHNYILGCEWQRVRLPNAGLIGEHCPPNIEEAPASP